MADSRTRTPTTHSSRASDRRDAEQVSLSHLALDAHHGVAAADEASSVPRADGGLPAWLFLAGASAMEALVWGFAFTFGIWADYYSTHPLFADSPNIAVIGTTQTGVMYMGLPFGLAILLRFPRWQRLALPAGFALSVVGLLAASFASSVPALVATQGVLFALGGGMAYAPIVIFLNDWFVEKRGFAFGTVIAGAGGAGIVLPFLFSWALPALGFRTVLRAWAVVLALSIWPLSRVIRARMPGSNTTEVRLGVLRSGVFAVFQIANVVEALGYFLPAIYLPGYVRRIGGTALESTLSVVLVNAATTAGCVIMGMLIDRFHVTTCILVSSLGSAVGVLALWGCAGHVGVVFAFCLVYGLFAGPFSSTWSGIGLLMSRRSGGEAGMVFAILSAGKGLGSVLSGPISEALLRWDELGGKAGLGYGTGYGAMIVFTGLSALLGSLGLLTRWSGTRPGVLA